MLSCPIQRLGQAAVKIRPTDHDLTSSEAFLNRTPGSGWACCVMSQGLEMPSADYRQPVRRSLG
jgi:hypothetical protein